MSDPRGSQDGNTAHHILVGHPVRGSELSTLLTTVLVCDVLFRALAVALSVAVLRAEVPEAASDQRLAIGTATLGVVAIAVGLTTLVFKSPFA
jgi:hypothetical protein